MLNLILPRINVPFLIVDFIFFQKKFRQPGLTTISRSLVIYLLFFCCVPRIDAQPANDMCAGAVIIPPGGPFPYLTGITDNSTATEAGDPVPSCVPFSAIRGLWYSFTPMASGSWTFSICQNDAPGSAIADNIIDIFTSAAGCTGPFSEVSGGCIDDEFNCFPFTAQARTTVILTSGTQYFILAYGYSPQVGNVQMQISFLGTPPENDMCGGAIFIPPSGPFPYLTVIINNFTATDAGDPMNSCGFGGSHGIWYSFQPSTTGTWNFSICQSDAPGNSIVDNTIDVFTSGAGCTGPFSEVSGGCDDSACGAPNETQAIASVNLTSGTDYFILVYSLNAGDVGDVQIQITNQIIVPIVLVNFEGKAMNNYNSLTWETASEFNSHWHIIERASSSTGPWTELGRVEAVGNSSAEQHYHMEDLQPFLHNTFYRLKSVDFDGQADYSKIVSILRKGWEFKIKAVYPIPATNLVNIDITSPESIETDILISDIVGKVIRKFAKEIESGDQTLQVQMSGLEPGTYFITLLDKVTKVIKY